MMRSPLARLLVLEERIGQPTPDVPDLSRLTTFEAATLRTLSERLERDGPEGLSVDEMELAATIAAKLWGASAETRGG